MNDFGKTVLTHIKNEKIISNNLLTLLYEKNDLELRDAQFLYGVALLLINEFEKDHKKFFLLDYAYNIIAKTSLKTNDFRALYDFTVNYGYYPIARKIIQLNKLPSVTLNQVFAEITIDEFSDSDRTLTFEQKNIFKKILDDNSELTSFLAPTSYGKSELIFKHIKKHPAKVVGIIVPTKALIDQVSREAKKQGLEKKIIVHDQNYSQNDESVLAIVTQERAIRLLEEGIIFDQLYIDEAHEMLKFNFGLKHNNRSLILARVIKLAKQRNSKIKLMYLSPVLNNSENLELSDTETIQEYRINNDLKILDIKLLGSIEENSFKRKGLFQYDKYLGTFYKIGDLVNQFEYIKKVEKNKNLHYLYRPIFIEEYAEKLYQNLPNIELSKELIELINELGQLVHPDFKMVKYIKKGIIYLHAKLPSNIKNYLLKYVRESNQIKHLVANSVILAGMNLPIDNLFYISGSSNLRDLYNLIGRVNRLNEIFSKKNHDLSKILIPVNFIEFDQFPQRGKMQNKVEKLRLKFNDEVKNPLLNNATIEQENKKSASKIITEETELIENFGQLKFKQKLLMAGAQQILNYTKSGVEKLQYRVENYKKTTNKDVDILDMVKQVFFENFNIERDFYPEYNAKRLENIATINYYKMFVNDLKKLNLKERIDKIVAYWMRQENDYKVYVGQSFGEVSFDSSNYLDSKNKVYVQLANHKDDEEFLNNLAIIKLQIDEDFLGHEISLLVNTLVNLDLINQADFDRFYYGTIKSEELAILQLGISRSLFNQLKKDKQIINIKFDKFGNAKANDHLIRYIQNQQGIRKFELQQYFS